MRPWRAAFGLLADASRRIPLMAHVILFSIINSCAAFRQLHGVHHSAAPVGIGMAANGEWRVARDGSRASCVGGSFSAEFCRWLFDWLSLAR